MIKNCVLYFFAFTFLFLIPALAGAQVGNLAIQGGEIHTVSGSVIQNGVVLISEGKIQAVGMDISIPTGVRIINAEGMIVTPGIIDARSSFGVRGASDRSNLISPARRIIDGFRQRQDSEWLRGGVTAVYITPGPQNLLGGFGAVVKLAGTGDEAVVKEIAGMSASFGESALDAFEAPTTRQGMVGILRQEFIRAGEYIEYRTTPDTLIQNVEAIAKVLRREVTLRVFANTPDDIMTALRVAKEFDLKLVIDSGAGAYLVADVLAESEVPVVVGPNIRGLGGGGPYEMFAQTPENAGRLHKAGVKVALSTNSGSGRTVLLEGVVAKGHGLPEAAALKAVTLDAAEILGVSERLGSIEPGKDADIVIWKDHPLSTWGESRIVIVNGQIVFER